MKGRVCTVCRERGLRRRMKPSLRHVHEAEPGNRIRTGAGEVATLVHVRPGRCEISATADPEKVSFEAQGELVEFTRSITSRTRPISPFAEVEVLP